MKVAYILSMATSGVSAWNYREIDILTQNGVQICAYPLTWTRGPYMPRPEWRFYRPNRLKTLLLQPLAFLANPGRYLKLLAFALKMRAPLEFLTANEFALDMRKQQVQHIHCHFGDRKLYTGYFCSRILDVPLSVTIHAYEILCNPNPAMFKVAAAACKWIVVQSEFNKKEVMRVFGVPEDRFKIIRAHGDMSDERMRQSTKLLIIGEFREKKGHEILFKAIKKLERDDLTLWVVGKGKLDVPRMAEDIGVSHLTAFLGELPRDMINILYDTCDIFVLPSRTASDGDREGIPAVLMEAMSHHKPVISTRHTGIPELVPETLVEENDVDGLAEAIAYLADNPSARAEMGRRNHEVIKNSFSDAAVLQLREVFASQPQPATTAQPEPVVDK